MTRLRLHRLLFVLVAGVLAALAVGVGGTALAHSAVKDADPGPASTVAGVVDSAWVEFLEPVLPTPQLTVRDPLGNLVDGLSDPVLRAGRVVAVTFDPLMVPGDYRVDYRFSAEDGHTQSGAHEFSFTGNGAPAVDDAPAVTESAATPPADIVDEPPRTDQTAAPAASDGRGALLPLGADAIRLFLHVLAACVWVGGQLVLAGLVPVLRKLGPEAPAIVARRFNQIAWPAFGVVVVTGLWNLTEVNFGDRDSAYQATVFVKLVVVGLSAASAGLHAAARSRVVLAVGGATAFGAALFALLLGVQLRLG